MKTIVSGILFVLLLVSVFMGAFNVQSARANASSRGQTVQATDTDWWPMFHHDLTHTGASTSTAPTTNNTQWTSTAGEHVASSPAVAGGLVYVGSNDPYGGGIVSCLNAATGAQVWNYTTSQAVDSSPAVAGGLVYVGAQWGDNHVYCLNATTGRQVWNYTTGDAVESSPAVAGGLVYVGSMDDNVYCLNAANGALVWNYTTGGSVAWSSPAVVGGLVYVGSWDDNVYCLNAANGALVWNYATNGEVSSSPAVVGGLVYVGSDNSRVYCLDAATGALIWNYTTGQEVWSSPAVAGGLVYVGGSYDHNVYCLDAATGAQVWNYTTGNDVMSSPAVVGGLVFAGSFDGNVYCLDATTGAQVWNYQTGGAVESSPAVVNGVVYVGSMDGKVYAFGPSLSPQTYSVSFSESGLAQGTQWSVTFNGTTSGSSSNTIPFYGVKDGTYSFTVGNVSGTFPAPADESITVASPSSGNITVNEANVNQAITFQYTVTLWDPVKSSYNINNPSTVWSNGNCYGLSSTAVLYFMHYTLSDNAYPYFPSEDPLATSTSDLNIAGYNTLNNATLAVMYHQVYGQNFPEPSTSAINEAGEYSSLIGNLTVGQPVVLGLGNATSWLHAVVAWGAGTIGNGNLAGMAAVYLYDSNYPRTTPEAIIDPATGNFSYKDPLDEVYNRFLVVDPTGMMPDSRNVGAFFKQLVSQPFWNSYSKPGYRLFVANKPITIIGHYNHDLKDYFTASGNSQTFVEGIPDSSGIEEADVQVYAIPDNVFIDIKDPGSNQSTLLITRVENESGQLVGYAYLLNVTSSQGSLNYTVTPSNSSLLISTGANALNASVVFSYATPQNCSVFTGSNVLIGAVQTANFTVTDWQMLGNTSTPPVTLTISTSVPEFSSALILPLFMIATLLAAVVLRRKRSGAHSEIVPP